METREHCPFCGSFGEEILEHPFDEPPISTYLKSYYPKSPISLVKGATVDVRYCSDCEFIWHGSILDDAELDELYDSILVDQSTGHPQGDPSKVESKMEIASSIVSLITNRPAIDPQDTDILEYGMGWGELSRLLNAYGYSVTGFDISESKREYVASRGVDVIESPSAIEVDTFDIIVLDNVLEHVPNPREVLETVEAGLRSGGCAILLVPNAEYAMPITLGSITNSVLHPLEHINGFTPKSIRSAAHQVGFQDVKALPESTVEQKSTSKRVSNMLGKSSVQAMLSPIVERSRGKQLLEILPSGTSFVKAYYNNRTQVVLSK